MIRLEIVYKLGGIYVDIDSTALRSFGPVFQRSFLSFRPSNWTKTSEQYRFLSDSIGTASLENNVFGFSEGSQFLRYTIEALKENFPLESATLYKTGPYFLKEAFLQYPYNRDIPLIHWDYVGGDGSNINSIIKDDPSDSQWDDNQ